MEMYLQILIGMIPAFLIAIIMLLVSKKRNKAPWGVIVVTLLISGLVIFLVKPDLRTTEKKEKNKSQASAVYDQYYQMINESRYTQALQMLASSGTEYDEQYLFSMSLFYAIEGDTHALSGIDSVLNEEFYKNLKGDENSTFEKIMEQVKSDNPDYTLMKTIALDYAASAVSSDKKNRNDEDETEHKNGEEYLQELSAEADSEDLMLAGEILRNGKYDTKSIEKNKEYKDYQKASESVADLIKHNDREYKYSKEEQAVLDAFKDTYRLDDKMTYSEWVFALMEDKAKEDVSSASKMYMEMAAVDYDVNNGDKTDNYISKSFDTAVYSSDAQYAYAAMELQNIMDNKNDTEARKNIDGYVDILCDAMTPQDAYLYLNEPENITFNDEAMDEAIDEVIAADVPEYADDSKKVGDIAGFRQYLSDMVNHSSSELSIITVDIDDSFEVNSVIAINNKIAADEEKVKSVLSVMDCNLDIYDYDVERVDYDKINLVLCCDNSGSMSDYGKIDDLKTALYALVDKLGKDAYIGMVPFDSSVITSNICPITSNVSNMNTCVDKMQAGGGTNIYSGVVESLNLFEDGKNDLNILIVMSDGQDSMPSADQLSQIKAICDQKHITIYTMGLGNDVQSEVLSAYSNACGGEYLFVSDAGSLLGFYEYIYNLGKNRYKITFEAKDKLCNSRVLRIQSVNSEIYEDEKAYSINGTEVYDIEEIAMNLVSDSDVSLYGLEKNVIYRSPDIQTISLYGKGFSDADDLSVVATGKGTINLDAEYIDDQEIIITVPENMNEGIYSLVVTCDGNVLRLNDELTISGATRYYKRFGDYEFVSSVVEDYTGKTVMSGDVVMNDWLNFSGVLTISGDEYSDYATLNSDFAYVNAVKQGIQFQTAALNDVLISKTGNYPNELYDGVVIPGVINIANAYMGIAPDRLWYSYFSGDAVYNTACEIFTNEIIDANEKFPHNEMIKISKNQISIGCIE